MNMEFHEIIDLTMDIKTGMSTPPGVRKALPQVEFKLYKDADRDGIQVGFFQSGIHAGTHLDAPRHILAGQKTIDQLDLGHFLGPGYCMDVSQVKANEPVTAAMMEPDESKIKPGMIVFLYSGWSDRMWGTDEYWDDSPYLSEDGAQWLVDHRVKIAGYDFFQDAGAKGFVTDPEKFVVHKILLGNGCLNIEHLTNLGKVANTDFFVIALPLKIIGAEGSPTRVIALR